MKRPFYGLKKWTSVWKYAPNQLAVIYEIMIPTEYVN
jgi:hypothetical protein